MIEEYNGGNRAMEWERIAIEEERMMMTEVEMETTVGERLMMIEGIKEVVNVDESMQRKKKGWGNGKGTLEVALNIGMAVAKVTKGGLGSPVDMAKWYMQARPSWTSSSKDYVEFRTPSAMGREILKEETPSIAGNFLSSSKRIWKKSIKGEIGAMDEERTMKIEKEAMEVIEGERMMMMEGAMRTMLGKRMMMKERAMEGERLMMMEGTMEAMEGKRMVMME
ncbi:Protein KAKU4 [Camellia lanceoleosa]|uniref:Protein KAKU4 n=1 Tax=Camellia lanceoleosa TaxID=1840588 RepID=A0ACC0J4H9_9ERIC|nr:Protein KAKU4 [Camellia lanceoleosa]